jgi:hypothetical protein
MDTKLGRKLSVYQEGQPALVLIVGNLAIIAKLARYCGAIGKNYLQ